MSIEGFLTAYWRADWALHDGTAAELHAGFLKKYSRKNVTRQLGHATRLPGIKELGGVLRVAFICCGGYVLDRFCTQLRQLNACWQAPRLAALRPAAWPRLSTGHLRV